MLVIEPTARCNIRDPRWLEMHSEDDDLLPVPKKEEGTDMNSKMPVKETRKGLDLTAQAKVEVHKKLYSEKRGVTVGMSRLHTHFSCVVANALT